MGVGADGDTVFRAVLESPASNAIVPAPRLSFQNPL